MSEKNVCLDCRKAFNVKIDSGDRLNSNCPDCGKKMVLLPHRFRPPQKTETKKWETVQYFISNGFYYQHIYDSYETSKHYNRGEEYVKYPENLREAKEFVEKYKSQARQLPSLAS